MMISKIYKKTIDKNHMIVYNAVMESEKRNYQRISDSIQIKFTTANKKWTSAPLGTTYTKNLSLGGFLFYSNHLIKVGEVIDIRFFLHSTNEFMTALARVVRIVEISSNKMYEIGIEFMEIEQTQLDILLGYIKSK